MVAHVATANSQWSQLPDTQQSNKKWVFTWRLHTKSLVAAFGNCWFSKYIKEAGSLSSSLGSKTYSLGQVIFACYTCLTCKFLPQYSPSLCAELWGELFPSMTGIDSKPEYCTSAHRKRRAAFGVKYLLNSVAVFSLSIWQFLVKSVLVWKAQFSAESKTSSSQEQVVQAF